LQIFFGSYIFAKKRKEKCKKEKKSGLSKCTAIGNTRGAQAGGGRPEG
jgi:hypothetical protein